MTSAMIEAARRASGIILNRQLTHTDDDLANFEQIWRKLRDPFAVLDQRRATSIRYRANHE